MASLRVKLALLIAGIVIGTLMVSPASAHVTTSASHLWTDHIKPLAVETFYTKTYLNKYFVRATDLLGGTAVNKSSNPVSWKKLKGVPAGLADGIDSGKYAGIKVVAKSGGDYASPIAAMNSITDASSSKHYVIYIAPGVYDLGTNALTIKDNVDVKGAGQTATTIVSRRGTEESLTPDATLSLADNSTVSDLTVKNIGVAGTKAAILAWHVGSAEEADEGTYLAVVRNVRAESSEGDGYFSFGVFNAFSSVKYVNVTARSTGTGTNTGFWNDDSSPSISDSEIYAQGDSSMEVAGFKNYTGSPRLSDTVITARNTYDEEGATAYGFQNMLISEGAELYDVRLDRLKINVYGSKIVKGVYNAGQGGGAGVTGDTRITDSEITVSGGASADVYGYYNDGGPASIEGTVIRANDITATSNGIYNWVGQIRVFGSTVSSSQNALNNATLNLSPGLFFMSGGGVRGDVEGEGPVVCSGVFSLTDRVLLGSNCAP